MYLNQEYFDRLKLLNQSMDKFSVEVPDTLRSINIESLVYEEQYLDNNTSVFSCEILMNPAVLTYTEEEFIYKATCVVNEYMKNQLVENYENIDVDICDVYTTVDAEKEFISDKVELSALLYRKLFDCTYYFDTAKYKFMSGESNDNKLIEMYMTQFDYLYEKGFKFEDIKTHLFCIRACSTVSLSRILERNITFHLLIYIDSLWAEYVRNELCKYGINTNLLICLQDTWLCSINRELLDSLHNTGIVYEDGSLFEAAKNKLISSLDKE